jgi:RNA-directed DNA polymerase
VTRPARTGQPQPLAPSRPRQRQLDQAAQRRRQRRFPALDDRLFRPALLGRAWREVRAPGGRAGVDGVRRADVEPQGVAAVLQALAPARGAGSSRPQPVLRGALPTPEGRHRPLGMPSVRERGGPQAGTSVLAPRCDAHFQHPSSGFRPRRRATPAVQVVQDPRGSPGSVGDGARAGCLDTREHAMLRRFVARRISARRVLTRRRQWWPAGGVDEGPWCPTARGSPPGGGMSPLWANSDVQVWARYGAPPYRWRGPLTR